MATRQSALGLRLVLGLVIVSHLLIGAAIMVAGDDGIRWAASAYGVDDLPLTPQFIYILKPLGAYMITIAAMSVAAWRDPVRHIVVIYGVAGLLGLRVLQRFAFASEIQLAFGLGWGRLLVQSGFFLAIAVALVWLGRRATTPTP